MLINRLSVLAGGLVMGVILGGWTHGSAVPSFEGATWKDALAKVPCQDVVKDGKDLKIAGIIVVDGKPSPDPIITKEDEIEPLDKRCFPRH
jgi:hypothetical protein